MPVTVEGTVDVIVDLHHDNPFDAAKAKAAGIAAIIHKASEGATFKDDQYKGFCGFQLWWFDKHRGVCDCCESHWTDRRKKITHYSLDKAAKILWKHRDSLYVRKKHVSEDKRIQILEQMQDVR